MAVASSLMARPRRDMRVERTGILLSLVRMESSTSDSFWLRRLWRKVLRDRGALDVGVLCRGPLLEGSPASSFRKAIVVDIDIDLFVKVGLGV